VVVVAAVTGCDVALESPEAVAQAEAAVVSANGTNLNGTNLNGRNLNGDPLRRMLGSVDFAGARLASTSGASGEAAKSVWLQGTVFYAQAGGQTFSGVDFTSARFTGRLDDGSAVSLRVESVHPGQGTDADVWTYRVAYESPTDGQWRPICEDAAGQPVDAIPLMGRWDYRQGLPGVGGAKYDDASSFTFACKGAALAKCVGYGYKPWASVNGVSLAAHHQACTRLIRADYCGDGASHTVDGQWVNLYDALGVQRDTAQWALEARWDTEGARCLTSSNRSQTPVTCGGTALPSCTTSGGSSPSVLLHSEVP
jgi:hypothetical protein